MVKSIKNFYMKALDYFTEDQVLINQSGIEDEANWKILHETLLEGYHIKSLHKDTFYPYGLDNINVVENYGQNSRVIFPFKRIEKLRDIEPSKRVIDGTITSVYSLISKCDGWKHLSAVKAHKPCNFGAYQSHSIKMGYLYLDQ